MQKPPANVAGGFCLQLRNNGGSLCWAERHRFTREANVKQDPTGKVEGYYRADAGRTYRKTHLGVASDRVYAAIARQRARKLTRYVDPGDRVFEFGVGTGFNLAALRCKERVGHDLYDASQELAEVRIRFCQDIRCLVNASFDVALCLHTLEHVVNPWNTLAEIHRLLKPGGRFIVCVPFEVARCYRRFDPSNIHQHLYSWNVQTLGMLLTKSGFALNEISVRKFGYDRFAARLPGGSRSDTAYLLFHWMLLQVRPRYEVMAVCIKPG